MILVSSCLLGLRCRYDGKEKSVSAVESYLSDKHYMAICPEQMGGLSTPRKPAEIVSLEPLCVLNDAQEDVTEAFKIGVDQVIKLIGGHRVTEAILKSRSPSCGSCEVYDGSFTKTLIKGEGVLCSALRDMNIKVKSELDI